MKINKKILRNFGLISQLGIVMVITLLGSIFLGIWLDKILNTNILFLIIFTILGVGASFRNLLKITMMHVDDSKDKENE